MAKNQILKSPRNLKRVKKTTAKGRDIKLKASILDDGVGVRTLNDREYLVFPIVALVEGVRWAGNMDHAELVPASVIASHPDAWNGRPIVVDHPEGDISGSSEETLSSTYIGMMMNSYSSNSKLLTEAWIDLSVVAGSTNDLVIDMKNRLDNGEVVEVSVGAYVYSNEETGQWEGEEYFGAWEVVVPGHLALLSSEIGACSIADGCGTFRQYSSSSIQFSGSGLGLVRSHMSGESKDKKVKNPKTLNEGDVDCDCSDSEEDSVISKDIEFSVRKDFIEKSLFSPSSYDSDRRQYLSLAVQKQHGKSSWVYAFNDDYVVFDVYDEENYSWKMYRDLYESSDSNKVSLSGVPEEVVNVFGVVSVDSILSGESESDNNGDKEKVMSKESTSTSTSSEGGSDAVATAPSSVEEMISLVGLDSELGKKLSGWQEQENAARKVIEDKVLAAGGAFSADQLSAMDLDTLKGIESLLTTQHENEPVEQEHSNSNSNVVSYAGAAGQPRASSTGTASGGFNGFMETPSVPLGGEK